MNSDDDDEQQQVHDAFECTDRKTDRQTWSLRAVSQWWAWLVCVHSNTVCSTVCP